MPLTLHRNPVCEILTVLQYINLSVNPSSQAAPASAARQVVSAHWAMQQRLDTEIHRLGTMQDEAYNDWGNGRSDKEPAPGKRRYEDSNSEKKNLEQRRTLLQLQLKDMATPPEQQLSEVQSKIAQAISDMQSMPPGNPAPLAELWQQAQLLQDQKAAQLAARAEVAAARARAEAQARAAAQARAELAEAQARAAAQARAELAEAQAAGLTAREVMALPTLGLALLPSLHGILPSGLTAREVMALPTPGLAELPSPYECSSQSQTELQFTYSSLVAWDGFQASLEQLLSNLDNTSRMYRSVRVPGLINEPNEWPAAADEREARAALTPMSMLLNKVAGQMGLPVQMVGGGGGRSASLADWLVRSTAAPRVSGISRVLAVIEVKAPWQWPAEPGIQLADLAPEERATLDLALKQCWGYMVAEGVPVGAVTAINATVLLKRSSDPTDLTLTVSPVIGVDKANLAFLFLMDQAHRCQAWRAGLERSLVPQPLPAGAGEGVSRAAWGSREGLAAQGSASHRPSPHALDPAPSQLGPQPRRLADSPCNNPAEAAKPEQESMDAQASWMIDDTPAGGISSRSRSSGSGSVPNLKFYTFTDVGFSDVILHSGLFGSILKGQVDGTAAVVKQFELKKRGSCEAFWTEWDIYQRLAAVQGTQVPRLLRYGQLYYTEARFLALSYEGEALPEDDDTELTPEQRARMRRALQAVHEAGVLHGDIRRCNFVQTEDGSIKVVDFGFASFLGPGCAGSPSADQELQELDSL